MKKRNKNAFERRNFNVAEKTIKKNSKNMPYGIDYKQILNSLVVKLVRVYPPEAAPKATRAVLGNLFEEALINALPETG